MLDPEDHLHTSALKITKEIYPVTIYTSEMVLTELLNAFSGASETLRLTAVNCVRELQKDPNTKIIKQTSKQFETALRLYKKRPDKSWSHTDCSSFVLMEKHRIRDALAHDKHFEQAGYRRLLRDESP